MPKVKQREIEEREGERGRERERGRRKLVHGIYRENI